MDLAGGHAVDEAQIALLVGQIPGQFQQGAVAEDFEEGLVALLGFLVAVDVQGF